MKVMFTISVQNFDNQHEFILGGVEGLIGEQCQGCQAFSDRLQPQ